MMLHGERSVDSVNMKEYSRFIGSLLAELQAGDYLNEVRAALSAKLEGIPYGENTFLGMLPQFINSVGGIAQPYFRLEYDDDLTERWATLGMSFFKPSSVLCQVETRIEIPPYGSWIATTEFFNLLYRPGVQGIIIQEVDGEITRSVDIPAMKGYHDQVVLMLNELDVPNPYVYLGSD